MSSERLPPAIDLVFSRSPWLASTYTAVYALAVAAVFLSGLPWAVKIVIMPGLAVFAIYHLCTRALPVSRRSVCRLIWRADGECEWQERGGRFRRGEPLPGVLITSVLVVVRIRMGRWRQRTFCIARDAVTEDAMRRLRLRLGVSPPPPPRPPSAIKRVGALWKRKNAARHIRLEDKKDSAVP